MTQDAVRWMLMAVVLPLWIALGLADWACHRRTAIERSGGVAENIFHWVMFAQMGVAVLAVAWLEVNAAVLLVVAGAFLAHEATTYAELRYAVPRRVVGPFEQMVHSFMEILPLVMLALLAVAAWEPLAAAAAGAPLDLGLRLKERPWPAGYLLGLGLAVLAFNVLPLAEEGWRCLRTRRRS